MSRECVRCRRLPESDADRVCATCGDRLYLGATARLAALKDPAIGTILAGRFGLCRIIATGGMGVVYEAIQLPIERRVAVKVLRRELLAGHEDLDVLLGRFRREAKIVSELAHPNVVVLHDFGEVGDGNLFMAFELIDGQTLQDAMRSGPLPASRVLRLAIQMAAGLEAAHRHGVVHRDLKPGNVMLIDTPDGEIVKLVDFGIAGLRDVPGAADLDLTISGKLTGTPRYMSPEQIRGERVDARSDIYSLGLILYELLAGRPAFDGTSPLNVLMAQLHEQVRPLPDLMGTRPLPPGLEELVTRSILKDKTTRFPRALDVRRGLEAIVRRGELGALWAETGDDPSTMFAILRRHEAPLIETVVEDIRRTVPSYRAQPRANVVHRIQVFFRWSAQLEPPDTELMVFLKQLWGSRVMPEMLLPDLLSAFGCVLPALRGLVAALEPLEGDALVRNWPLLERHFWMLVRVVVAGYEAAVTEISTDTFSDGTLSAMATAPRVTILRHALGGTTPQVKPESGDFFENVMASMPTGVLVIDTETLTIRAANPAVERIFDVAAGSLVGRHVLDVYRTLRDIDVPALVAELQSEQRLSPKKIRLRPGEARERWIVLRGGAYLDADNQARGVTILVDDVTEREFLVDSLRRYLGPDVAADLITTKRGLSLTGQRMPITVMFVGLVGEGGPGTPPNLGLDGSPEVAIGLLNRYFGAVLSAVTENRGLVDAFVKDTVMALFGAPFGHEDDPYSAVLAARDLLERVARLDAELQAAGLPPLRASVGIATGEAIVGNVGSLERLNYTAVGEVVYRADRLRLSAPAMSCVLDEATVRGLAGRLKVEPMAGGESTAYVLTPGRPV